MTEEVPQVRPWVRYWARLFDVYLFSLIVGFVPPLFGVIPNPESPEVEVLYGMIILFAWVLVESLLLSVWGSTPGKWLLRITLTDLSGAKPKFQTAFERSLSVWLRGLGLGLPFVAFIANLISYRQLIKNGTTWWDRGKFMIRHGRIGSARIILIVSFFVCSVLLVALGSYSS